MHEVSAVTLSIFPRPYVIRYLFNDLRQGDEEEIDSTEFPQQEKIRELKKAIKKHFNVSPYSFMMFLRHAPHLESGSDFLVVCYNKSGNSKYYIEFPDLNNPEFVYD